MNLQPVTAYTAPPSLHCLIGSRGSGNLIGKSTTYVRTLLLNCFAERRKHDKASVFEFVTFTSYESTYKFDYGITNRILLGKSLLFVCILWIELFVCVNSFEQTFDVKYSKIAANGHLMFKPFQAVGA